MPRRYEEIYPSSPLLSSDAHVHVSAAALMSVRYFQAEPDVMPEEVFAEHHVLLNLQDQPHRVQNRRDGELRDFTFHKDEIIVTPAGMRSGWPANGRVIRDSDRDSNAGKAIGGLSAGDGQPDCGFPPTLRCAHRRDWSLRLICRAVRRDTLRQHHRKCGATPDIVGREQETWTCPPQPALWPPCAIWPWPSSSRR